MSFYYIPQTPGTKPTRFIGDKIKFFTDYGFSEKYLADNGIYYSIREASMEKEIDERKIIR